MKSTRSTGNYLDKTSNLYFLGKLFIRLKKQKQNPFTILIKNRQIIQETCNLVTEKENKILLLHWYTIAIKAHLALTIKPFNFSQLDPMRYSLSLSQPRVRYKHRNINFTNFYELILILDLFFLNLNYVSGR